MDDEAKLRTYTSLTNEFKISNYKDIKDIFTDEQEELFGSILFDATQRYYKQKINSKIIIPQLTNKTDQSTINKFFSGVKTRIWDLYSAGSPPIEITKDEEISYFTDIISTDILDSAITEIPVEIQLLQPETCDVVNNLNTNLVTELQDLYNESLKLKTEDKIKIRNELRKQLITQNEVLKTCKR